MTIFSDNPVTRYIQRRREARKTEERRVASELKKQEIESMFNDVGRFRLDEFRKQVEAEFGEERV
jgi:hypothetical protein